MSGVPDARLLIEHASFVRRVARGILSDEDAAEEIVQGTFLQALRHPPRTSGSRSWLARVARNLAISRWRAERSRHARELVAARPEPVSGPEKQCNDSRRSGASSKRSWASTSPTASRSCTATSTT